MVTRANPLATLLLTASRLHSLAVRGRARGAATPDDKSSRRTTHHNAARLSTFFARLCRKTTHRGVLIALRRRFARLLRSQCTSVRLARGQQAVAVEALRLRLAHPPSSV